MIEKKYHHFSFETDDDKIVWLRFDREGEKVNSLSKEALEELYSITHEIAYLRPAGMVLYSGKETGFIAGADVREFVGLDDEKGALELIRRGQKVMDAVEGLPFPTVAMIHGFCLGGGLELALACEYRVASDDGKTKLGFPEVMLGIHPGFGGTVRATHLLGGIEGMGMVLTGRAITAKKAKKIGLVEYVVPNRNLREAAKSILLNPPENSGRSLKAVVSNIKPVRMVLSHFMKKKVLSKANPKHYPAPMAAVNLWRNDYSQCDHMMAKEAKSVARLITGSTAKNLVRLFFLQESMKASGKGVDFKPTDVHVVGAGVMGGDIASWLALRGFSVTLQDTDIDRVGKAIGRAHTLFKKKLKEPRLVQSAMDRLVPDLGGDGVRSADVVIEAIFENADAKKSLYATIEPNLKEGALLATNTSSIPLELLAESLNDPGRFVGLHFFNPVSMMKLVEVVKGASTSPETLKKATAFVISMDRLPLTVKSSPGFLVNRLLLPYLMEGMALAEEGVAMKVIDRAAKKFGMPMGPITLADTVGLDICLNVCDILSDSMNIKTPDSLRQMVKAGHLGKKSGRGFYSYAGGKQSEPEHQSGHIEPDDMVDRMILRLVNEAVACIRENVVEDTDSLDAGMVFGTGFAPFRGGPMNYARTGGFNAMRDRLNALATTHGERFTPDEGWRDFISV